VKKVSWITTGNFGQRLAKESVVIFPCALIFAYYYVFVRSAVVEFSVLKLFAVAIGITLSLGIYNARKPAPQPATDPSDSDALLSLRRDEIG
jgi:hypothetical protein